MGELAADLPEGLRLAADALDNGAAAAALARWVDVSHRLANAD